MDQNQNRNQDPNNNKGPKNKQSLLVLLICIMVSLFGMNMLSRMTSNVSSEISYSEFIQLLDKGQVESVVINSDDLKVTLKNSGKLGNGTKTVIATEDENELTKRLDEANVEFKREKPNGRRTLICNFKFCCAGCTNVCTDFIILPPYE